MLGLLHQRVQDAFGVGFAYQAVFTKAEGDDAHPQSARARMLVEQIHEVAPTCLPPVFTSAQMGTGIDDLRRAVGEACGLAEKTALSEMELDEDIEYHYAEPRSSGARARR